MISNDNFRILTPEEESQYKFPFCCPCEFYPCELVGECGSVNGIPEIHESQIPILRGRIVATSTEQSKNTEKIYMAKAVSPVHDKYDGDTIADTSHSHSTSPDAHRAIRLSYDQEEFKTDCIMSSLHVCQIECGQKRVSEGIGEHFKIETDYDGTIRANVDGKWEPLQPVFISAQTGQGKNYFVENVLVPYVRELNYRKNTKQRVLILSNRLALRQQIKNRLKGTEDSDEEEAKFYPYRDCADVMTYQSILHCEQMLKKRQSKAQSRYIYIICDEAHFFTSDAMFNPHTSKILEAIVRLFQDAVRVYMSATPYECLEYIIKYEREYHSRLNFNRPQEKDKSIPMAFYHFQRDYSYLDVKVYSAIGELYGQMIESVNQKREKWLVFIDDIEKCRAVKKDLEGYAEGKGSPLVVVDGDSKTEKVFDVDASSKANPSYRSMVLNECLDKNTFVLITTSVLDNGVNLTGINNIVVSDMERVKCLQMLGRARVSDADDRKTLYVQRFDCPYVQKRIDSFQTQKTAYHNYRLAYGELPDTLQSRGYDEYRFLDKYYNGGTLDWINAKHWFGRPMDKPTELYLNEIAKSLLDRRTRQYQLILDEMIEESPQAGMEQQEKKRVGQKYLEYQLFWFGKVYCVDDDITFADKDKAKKTFVAFLESYADNVTQIVGEAGKTKFSREFTQLYDAAFGRADRNKNRIYSITKMKSLLEDAHINYTVVSYSSYWIVQEHDWETEEE